MPQPPRVVVYAFVQAALLATAAARASAQAPSHQHYAQTAEAQRPAPDGSLAHRTRSR
jgi:hypothetical protein